MILIKSKNKSIDDKIYKSIVEKYFEYIRTYNEDLGAYDISELLRYSLCKYFNLESKGSKTHIEAESDRCVQYLKCTLDKFDFSSKSNEYKSGVLEACVHCIELSREKAGV